MTYMPDSPIYSLETDNATHRAYSSKDGIVYNISTPWTMGLSRNVTTLSEHIEVENKPRSGLNTFYSISYMYFHLIGTLVTIVTAIIGSLLTQPKHLVTVNEKCLLPLTVVIPSVIQRCCLRRRQRRENITRESDIDENDKMIRGQQTTI